MLDILITGHFLLSKVKESPLPTVKLILFFLLS